MIYLLLQPVVGLDPYGVEDLVILKVFINTRGGEGGVGPEVELLAAIPVSFNYGIQEPPPAVSGVDVTWPKQAPSQSPNWLKPNSG